MMGRWAGFVLLADMRTGSNYVETNLNRVPGLTCYGEVFNPHFIGHKGQEKLLGITTAARDKAPETLLQTMQQKTEGLAGFRLFHDHDARVFDKVLPDKAYAKVVLTRNPLDSYVSLKIARKTGQWMLTDAKHRKAARVKFDEAEFLDHLTRTQSFQARIRHILQTTGQAGFHLRYDEVNDLDVINGLLAFLGAEGSLPALSTKLKRQNPAPIAEKVTNYAEVEAVLARIGPAQLGGDTHAETRRGPMVPNYVAGAHVPLLYQPIPGAAQEGIEEWLAAIDQTGVASLARNFTQKSLRQWKRQHPGHRSFTVLSHPLARAHRVFCARILATGPGAFREIRQRVRNRYDVPLPDDPARATYTLADHRKAFAAYLRFLEANLAGQTNIRVDAHWDSQENVLNGLAGFGVPDLLVREDTAQADLAFLARSVGADAPLPLQVSDDTPYLLREIYDGELENMARRVYRRDYMKFGFSSWTDPAG